MSRVPSIEPPATRVPSDEKAIDLAAEPSCVSTRERVQLVKLSQNSKSNRNRSNMVGGKRRGSELRMLGWLVAVSRPPPAHRYFSKLHVIFSQSAAFALHRGPCFLTVAHDSPSPVHRFLLWPLSRSWLSSRASHGGVPASSTGCSGPQSCSCFSYNLSPSIFFIHVSRF